MNLFESVFSFPSDKGPEVAQMRALFFIFQGGSSCAHSGCPSLRARQQRRRFSLFLTSSPTAPASWRFDDIAAALWGVRVSASWF